MSNDYGAVGTNPLVPMDNSPEHELATLLKDNYDQEITGIPITDINFEQWFSGYGDIAIFFADTGSFNVGNNLGHRIEDIDHYTDVHVFVRSIKTDYANSAEKKCFDIEKWIRKVIQQKNTALKDKGILYIRYEDSRSLPYFDSDNTDYDNIVNRVVISVLMKIRNINNATT